MNYLKKVLTEDEINKVLGTQIKGRRHPLSRIIKPSEKDLIVHSNTLNSLKWILNKDPDWISNEKIKKRLLNNNYYSTSSGALGEIRAYGALLEAGFKVKPSKTPDFIIIEENEEVWVEVHCPQLSQREAQKLEQFRNDKDWLRDKKQGVYTKVTVIAPWGRKEGKNVTEAAISKIAARKQKEWEKQFSKSKPSVLWLDFQDEIWNQHPDLSSICPIRSCNGEFNSGQIWYGIYGWKGAPVFEGKSTERRLISKMPLCEHNGLFIECSWIDAVIISIARAIIILENPNSSTPLKSWFFEKATFLPWFNFEHSKMNWPSKNLKSRIRNEKSIITNLSKVAKYSW